MVASCFILGMCAFIMIGIGISQFRSTDPVGFYNGEKPPKKEELTDVTAWNKKHGTMWILYGIVIILSWVIGFFIGDTLWYLIPFLAAIILPLLVMIWYHHHLIKRYKRPTQK